MVRSSLTVPLVIAALAGSVAAQTDLTAPPPAAAPASPTAAFDQALDQLLARPGGLTAAAAGTRAAQASPAAERKDAETVGALERVREIQRAIMPVVSVGASYTRLSTLDPVMFAPGVTIPMFFNSYHLGSEVALPLTEILAKLPVMRDSAKDGAKASELSAKAARLTAATDAQVAYYEWIRAQLQVAVTTRLVAQVQSTLGQVQALADAQRAARGDVLRLQAQQSQVELALAKIQELVTMRELQLRIAIAAGDDEVLTIGEDVRAAQELPPLPATDVLITEARARRLEAQALVAASHSIERALAGSKVGALPRFDVFGQVAYDNPNQRVFPQKDEFKLTWAAGARITWSMNSYLSVDPQIGQAKAQIHALAADQRALGLGIRAEVTSARSALELADRSLAATVEGLASAEEAYRVRQELLANQRATATELVDAETALTQARFTAIDALIDRRIAWVRLRHAAGLDLP